MKIGSRVYVSFLSGSKIAGETGTVVGTSTRDGYKVRTDFGVIGYVAVHHVTELLVDAPSEHISAKVKGSLMDTDVAHMYLSPIKPLDDKDPTDLLCRPVVFNHFFTGINVSGFVSDQWIEDGVELLNIVHDGIFTVTPRSTLVCVLKRNIGTKLYSVDYYI